MINEKKSSAKTAWLIFLHKYLHWVPLVLGFAIALLAPIDVLRVSGVNSFVNFASGFIPMANRLSQLFELTQVAQFYYSLIWISLPVIYHLDVGKKRSLLRDSKLIEHYFGGLLHSFRLYG